MFNTLLDKLSASDRIVFEMQISDRKEAGWSDQDIYRYLSLTEEIDPDIQEEVALRLMRKIAEKYAV